MTTYFVPRPEQCVVDVVFDDPGHAESHAVRVHVLNAPEKYQTQALWWVATAATAVAQATAQWPSHNPWDLPATLTIDGSNPP